MLIHFLFLFSLLVPSTAPSSQAADSSSASYPSNVPKLLADLRKRNAELEATIAKLTKENQELRDRLAASVTPDPDGRIERAINDHRLVEGMTLSQANESLKDWGPPRIVDETANEVTYQWGSTQSDDPRRATFRNGKLVRHSE